MIKLYLARLQPSHTVEELLSRVELSVGEKLAAWERMRPQAARESIGGILLLQEALCRAGLAPAGLTPGVGTNGRPHLKGVALDFNLSHSQGLLACAVSDAPDRAVGVDVECLLGRSAEQLQRIAERWFTAAERERLECDPSELSFLRLWTGKEAAAKQSGVGLCGVSALDTLAEPIADRLVSYRIEKELSVCPFNEPPVANALPLAVLTLCGAAEGEEIELCVLSEI